MSERIQNTDRNLRFVLLVVHYKDIIKGSPRTHPSCHTVAHWRVNVMQANTVYLFLRTSSDAVLHISRIKLDEKYTIMYGFWPKMLWVSYKIKYQLLNLTRSLVSFPLFPQWGRNVAGDYEIIVWLELRHCWRVQIQNIVICGHVQYVLYESPSLSSPSGGETLRETTRS